MRIVDCPGSTCWNGEDDLEDRFLCRNQLYDFNTVEFAVEDGVPYAIDFLNPAPDADLHSVGPANFEWIVQAVAEFSVSEALKDAVTPDYHWAPFLKGAARTAAE